MSAKAVDMTMNRLVHDAFRREIVRIRNGLAQLPVDDRERAEGLARRWDFCSSQMRRHLTAEDEFLWPLVRERSDKPEEIVVIEAMGAEHEVLAEMLPVLDGQFSSLWAGEDVARDQVEGNLADLLLAFSGHCAHEDRDATPILLKYFTTADLGQFHTYLSSGEQSRIVVAWVCDGADERDRAVAWGMVPVLVRMVAKPMATRKYREFTRRCGL